MSQVATAQIEPNLHVFTEKELDELLNKIGEYRRSGNNVEARRLTRLLPLRPSTADFLKKDIGIYAMIEEGCNLSEAVKEFGHEWLYS